jgi:hypothetical protein
MSAAYITIEEVPQSFQAFALYLEDFKGRTLSEGRWNMLFAMCKTADKLTGQNVIEYHTREGRVYNAVTRQAG